MVSNFSSALKNYVDTIWATIYSDFFLISEYSCAMQKDILIHGRLYATVNYLCFYANIFRWETSVALKWKDVNGLTKEKTALVIPNAIQVRQHDRYHLGIFFQNFILVSGDNGHGQAFLHFVRCQG